MVSAGKAVPEVAEIMGVVKKKFPEASHENMGFGAQFLLLSRVTAQQESRLQAARRYSEVGKYRKRVCHKEISFKPYQLGMLPFIIDEGELPFHNLDYSSFRESRRKSRMQRRSLRHMLSRMVN